MPTLQANFRGPTFSSSPVEMARQVTEWARNVIIGKLNVTLSVTLAANATSTVISDPRIGFYSAILLMPLTSDAAAALGTTYVSAQQKGQATISHANNAEADRTFRAVILG